MADQIEVFDSGARARSSDPKTSKAAAASVTNLRASHRRVLAMFKLYGDMTDEQLTESIHDAEKDAGLAKLMSPSGVRSRRSELSKPNMDRLREIKDGMHDDNEARAVAGTYDRAKVDDSAEFNRVARGILIIEGLRSELWDTGRRATLASGRSAIVWGLAR